MLQEPAEAGSTATEPASEPIKQSVSVEASANPEVPATDGSPDFSGIAAAIDSPSQQAVIPRINTSAPKVIAFVEQPAAERDATQTERVEEQPLEKPAAGGWKSRRKRVTAGGEE